MLACILNTVNFMDSYEVYIDDDDLLFLEGTSIGVHWSPLSILPVVNADDYSVDIRLTELIDGSWRELLMLGSDLPNTGFAQLAVPAITESKTLFGSITPIMIQVSVSAKSTEESNLSVKRGIVSDILQKLGKSALRIIKNSPIRFIGKVALQAGQRLLCERWSSLQLDGIGEAALEMLPPCPRTVAAANIPNSGFVEERVSSIVPLIGTIQNYFGSTIVDNEYREFFHPGTSSCFRQRITRR